MRREQQGEGHGLDGEEEEDVKVASFVGGGGSGICHRKRQWLHSPSEEAAV